jgi:hypothetical protein
MFCPAIRDSRKHRIRNFGISTACRFCSFAILLTVSVIPVMNYGCMLVLIQKVVSRYVLQLKLDLHSLAVCLFRPHLNFFLFLCVHHKERNSHYENAADCRCLGTTVIIGN